MGESKTRNTTFAYLQVLGFLLVVTDHMGLPFPMLNSLFPINSFHMALFMFISGYFYNPSRHLIEQIKRKILHLLIPYYVYSILFIIITIVLDHLKICCWGNYELPFYQYFITNPFIYGNPLPNDSAWFVIVLLSVSLVYLLIDHSVIKTFNIPYPAYTLLFCFISCCSVYYVTHFSISDHFALILKTCFFIPFYNFGRVYRENFEEKFNESRYNRLTVSAVCILINIILLFSIGYDNLVTNSIDYMQGFHRPYYLLPLASGCYRVIDRIWI